MNGQEQTPSVSTLSPETLKAAKESSEIDEGSPDFEHQLKQRINKKEALQRMVEVSEEMRLYDE